VTLDHGVGNIHGIVLRQIRGYYIPHYTKSGVALQLSVYLH